MPITDASQVAGLLKEPRHVVWRQSISGEGLSSSGRTRGDSKLALKPGATRKDVLDAMQGHVLTQGELVGVFQKRVTANGS
jgi:hypothetical protein